MPPRPTNDSYPGIPGTPIYAGRAAPGGGGGSLLTTLTLVNTSGSEQAANFVAPMFGQPFVQGDVPSGQYPAFELTDGTPCPATIHSVTSWPDGSMKWCGVLMRVPTTIAGSGSLTINVKNGGSAPSASSRTTGDLTAADLSTVLTGVTNLTGEWTASLNTAITDADDIVSLGDGPAGRIWRIGGPFKQSGSAHGQLHCWHYVAALQNSSGGLLGLRYLGRAAQPWADVLTPTPTTRRVTAALKSGSTTLRNLQGVTAGEVTSANIDFDHYTSFFTAGADGKWDFVQGGGSASSDCTVRVQFDKTYFVKTRCVSPYDLALSPTPFSSVNYLPYGRAPYQERDMGSTGIRGEIGVLPVWVAQHVLTQSANDERACRVAGLASGGWTTVVRKSSTGQPVACVDVSPSYTGLGTIETSWRFITAGTNGPVVPAALVDMWPYSYESSHRPSAAFYPYLITGEPQFLDLLVEHATEIMLASTAGTTTFHTTLPIGNVVSASSGTRNVTIGGTTYKGGGGLVRSDHYRVPAWLMRDLAQAAAIYPDACPFGTGIRTYLRDLVSINYSAATAYNAAMASSWRDAGTWTLIGGSSSDIEFESPWALPYLSEVVCHTENILPGLGALAFRQHLAKFYAALQADIDIACLPTYRMSQYKNGGVRVDSTDELLFSLGGTLTSSTSTNRITTSGDWNPTNGDVFMFTSVYDADKPFAEATNNTRLYAVNVSGKTFQLSLTPGGAPLTVTSNVTITTWFCRLQNASPLFSFEGAAGSGSYISSTRAAITYHVACGDSVASDAQAAIQARANSAGITYTADPKWAYVPNYPA